MYVNSLPLGVGTSVPILAQPYEPLKSIYFTPLELYAVDKIEKLFPLPLKSYQVVPVPGYDFLLAASKCINNDTTKMWLVGTNATFSYPISDISATLYAYPGNKYDYGFAIGTGDTGGSGTDLIDGQANLVIQYQYSLVGFISISTGWIIV